MAIHDRYYASRPATFAEFRWRLQLIAEETVGRAGRVPAAEEDQAVGSLFATARRENALLN